VAACLLCYLVQVSSVASGALVGDLVFVFLVFVCSFKRRFGRIVANNLFRVVVERIHANVVYMRKSIGARPFSVTRDSGAGITVVIGVVVGDDSTVGVVGGVVVGGGVVAGGVGGGGGGFVVVVGAVAVGGVVVVGSCTMCYVIFVVARCVIVVVIATTNNLLGQTQPSHVVGR